MKLLLALSVSLLTGTLVTVFWLNSLYRREDPVNDGWRDIERVDSV